MSGQAGGQQKDVFLCHASADKADYVRPLAKALSEEGISCWLDEAELQWGDRLLAKIEQGLQSSRFVIVCLSASFIGRRWPEAELGAAVGMEDTRGEKTVLPLILNSEADVCTRYPIVTNLFYLQWDLGLEEIVDRLKPVLGLPCVEEDGLPEYLADGAAIQHEIADLEVRLNAVDALRKSSLADGLEKELAHLHGILPIVAAGYPRIHTFGLEMAVEAQGLILSPCAEEEFAATAPTEVLEAWCRATDDALFSSFSVFYALDTGHFGPDGEYAVTQGWIILGHHAEDDFLVCWG